MLAAVDVSELSFDWDLLDIDISQTDISSSEFSFQGDKYLILLQKKEGVTEYGCYLKSVETLSTPGIIHYRFDLLKRLDNNITKFYQGTRKLKELHQGWGKADWVDPATIQDHVIKVKMWTSEYDFEYDLENSDITSPSFSLSFFIYGEITMRVLLKKNKEGTKYDCLLKDVDSDISGKVGFQVDLFKRLDNRLVQSEKCEITFNKTDVVQGLEDWFDVETIREHVIKVKVVNIKPFSDFVEKPIGFVSVGILLFEKTGSNLSFLVGEEVVYVIQSILTSRNDYFRAMLEGSFKETQVPMTVESKILIHGMDVEVFKMIIEWIYTMDIKSLNDPFSPSLLLDLQVYHLV
jgi:hypothetical protein